MLDLKIVPKITKDFDCCLMQELRVLVSHINVRKTRRSVRSRECYSQILHLARAAIISSNGMCCAFKVAQVVLMQRCRGSRPSPAVALRVRSPPPSSSTGQPDPKLARQLRSLSTTPPDRAFGQETPIGSVSSKHSRLPSVLAISAQRSHYDAFSSVRVLYLPTIVFRSFRHFTIHFCEFPCPRNASGRDLGSEFLEPFSVVTVSSWS